MVMVVVVVVRGGHVAFRADGGQVPLLCIYVYV